MATSGKGNGRRPPVSMLHPGKEKINTDLPEMCTICKRNIRGYRCDQKIKVVEGVIQMMPRKEQEAYAKKNCMG